MREGHEERLQTARDLYEDLETYMAAGFTREEAMQWLCRTQIHVSTAPVSYPPEVHEFWERQNALATKIMVEMEDDE